MPVSMSDRGSTSGWWPFVLASLTLAAGAMGATMASPLFPIYETEWGISHGMVTVLYVAYMVGVLAALLFLTQMTERVGAVVVLRGGGLLLVTGLLLSALAPGVKVLLLARVMIGLASGLITSSATLAIFRFEPKGSGKAALVASATTMIGFGLGPFVCGLIAQFAPAPLVLPYLSIMAVMLVLLLCLTLFLHRDPGRPEARLSLLPRLGLPERAERRVFLISALAVFEAYGLFSLLASLAPSFLPLILPWHGPAISGSAVAVVLLCSAMVQLPARKLRPRTILNAALALMTGGTLILILAMHLRAPALFLLADLAIGCGHGLSFLSGMKQIDRITTPLTRGPILSSFLCIAYTGATLPILAVGWLADHAGLAPAVDAFCAMAITVCLTLFLLHRRV